MSRKGVLLADKMNKNLETYQLAPTLFYHLPVFFYLKRGFLNPQPLSLNISSKKIKFYPKISKIYCDIYLKRRKFIRIDLIHTL